MHLFSEVKSLLKDLIPDCPSHPKHHAQLEQFGNEPCNQQTDHNEKKKIPTNSKEKVILLADLPLLGPG